MRKELSYLLIFILIITSCQKNELNSFDNLSILDKLNSLEGVIAIEINNEVGYGKSFKIDIIQPIDHNNQDGATFSQRIYLTHTDENMPMVFAPSGYAVKPSSSQEIATELQTNCLNVTHRYFINATPTTPNWSYLTIEQAAKDHHRIVELFKKIYKNVWISSGVSKSGLTCTYHKYYYPDDIDATIAYVAPYKFSIDDQRFEAYIKTIGAEECYQRLRNFQTLVFENRGAILGEFEDYKQHSDYSWSLEPNLIIELVTMDYPFIFWQYHQIDCSEIPTQENSVHEIFDHLNSIVPFINFSDQIVDYYSAYYYQALTQTGAPGYDYEFYNGLLNSISLSPGTNPNLMVLSPVKETIEFDEATISTIYKWLQTQGDKIIYIYGENDPWTAGAIELSRNVDAIKVSQPGRNHRVKIADLDNPEIVYNKLEEWLGIEVTPLYGGLNSIKNDMAIKIK